MKIDIHNYEAFFLDFVEGRLDDASTLEMLSFLRKHPDLKAELESFTDIRLEPSEITFKEKDQLKKFDFLNSQVDIRNFEDFCIAHYEKLLSPSESEKLFNFLALNPEKQNDFQLYGKTSLKADASVIFEAKPFLKKKPKGSIRTVILKWTAVAAGIVLIVSVFYKSPDKDDIKIPKNIVTAQSENVGSKVPLNNDQPKVLAVKTGKKSTTIFPAEPVRQSDELITEREDNLPLLNPVAAKIQNDNKEEYPEYLIAVNSAVSSDNEAYSEEIESFEYAQKLLREKVLKSKGPATERRRLSLWDLAAITLKGYNSISEKDIILHRETDENGKLRILAIETENKKYGFESKN